MHGIIIIRSRNIGTYQIYFGCHSCLLDVIIMDFKLYPSQNQKNVLWFFWWGNKEGKTFSWVKWD